MDKSTTIYCDSCRNNRNIWPLLQPTVLPSTQQSPLLLDIGKTSEERKGGKLFASKLSFLLTSKTYLSLVLVCWSYFHLIVFVFFSPLLGYQYFQTFFIFYYLSCSFILYSIIVSPSLLNPILHTCFRDSCFTGSVTTQSEDSICDGSWTIKVHLIFKTGHGRLAKLRLFKHL